MCTEGLNLNSAVMPQAGQVTDSAIFMVSICASASWRHWRQFTMSSPSALPMNAKDSESKRGIINFVRAFIFLCTISTNRGHRASISRHARPGRAVRRGRAVVECWRHRATHRHLRLRCAAPCGAFADERHIVAATAEAQQMRSRNAHPVPSGKCGCADCQCWRNWER